jgi:hypothetical protein
VNISRVRDFYWLNVFRDTIAGSSIVKNDAEASSTVASRASCSRYRYIREDNIHAVLG